MHAVRHLLAQRRLAVLICTAALLLKLLVPTGYMIQADHGRLTLVVCAGVVSRDRAVQGATTHDAGMHGDMADHGHAGDHGKVEMPCAFAGFSAAMLGAIDPVQLAALIAFVLATGLVVTVPAAPLRRLHLRPPLRGPPGCR